MNEAFACHGSCRQQFNQDISSWDVSKVTNMYNMLYNGVFNQDISSWDVSKVTNFQNMLGRCWDFQQILCGASWVVHAGREEEFYWAAGAKISLAIDTCAKCSSITNDGIFCAASGRNNGLVRSGASMCEELICTIDADAKTCCACDVSDGTLANAFACACGASPNLRPALCAGGEFCNAQANLCAPHPIPTCEYRDGFQQNPISTCACGLVSCSTSNSFCNALQSDCRSAPICSHGNGKQVNSERCSCGTSYCVSGQFCYEPISQCVSNKTKFDNGSGTGPVCDFTDGSAPHTSSPSCICGSSGYCTTRPVLEENGVAGPYCYAPTSECTLIPGPDRVNECAFKSNEARNIVACTCGDTVCEPNYNGPFCLASTSQCSCAPGSFLVQSAGFFYSVFLYENCPNVFEKYLCEGTTACE